MSLHDLPLLISLVFGAGQCIFGAAVIVYGVRAGRWRRTGVFLLMVLGAWALCSGTAELLVSGLAVAARAPGGPSAAALASVRRLADNALVAASVALLVPLLLFSVWKRATRAAADARQAGKVLRHDATGQKD